MTTAGTNWRTVATVASILVGAFGVYAGITQSFRAEISEVTDNQSTIAEKSDRNCEALAAVNANIRTTLEVSAAQADSRAERDFLMRQARAFPEPPC